ncbi:hypothetical protein ACLB14_22550 (plasmid) [Escherichia coli]
MAAASVIGIREGSVILGITVVPAEYAKDAFDFVKQLVIVEIQCRPGTGHVALPGGLMADDDKIIYRMIYFSACKYQARIYYAINDKYHIICGFPSTQVRFPAKPEPHFSA